MYFQFIHRASFTLQGEASGDFLKENPQVSLSIAFPASSIGLAQQSRLGSRGCFQTQGQQPWGLHFVHAARSAGICTGFYCTLSSSSLLVKLARSLPNESSICLICLSFSAILHKEERVTDQHRRCGWKWCRKHQAKPKTHPGPSVQLLLQILLTVHFGSKSFSILNAVCLPKNL